MCENARAPPPDRTIADRAPGQTPGHARDVVVELGRTHDVRLDRVQRRRPGVERASAGSDVIGDELTAVQLVSPGERRRGLAARRHDEDAVRLLEAELRPGVVARRAPGVEDDEVVRRLRAIEQRAVAGGGALSVDRRGASRAPKRAGDRWGASASASRPAIASSGTRSSTATTPPSWVAGARAGPAGASRGAARRALRVKGERQRRGGVEQFLEVGAIDGEQIAPRAPLAPTPRGARR